jgi:Kef-type K+ transport system membrane component KefB
MTYLSDIWYLLLSPALWLALIVPQAIWRLLRLRWPQAQFFVVALLVGVVCGPSLLAWQTWLLPYGSTGFRHLATLATNSMGFLAGLHIILALPTAKPSRQQSIFSNSMVMLSITIVVAQLVLAWPLAWLLVQIAPATNTPWLYAALMVILPVIALPVLTAALLSMGQINSLVGRTAMQLSVNSELYLWPALMVLTALATGNADDLWKTVLLALAYGLVMWFILRPLLLWLSQRWFWPSGLVLALVAVFSIWATESLGLHALLGAVVAGLCTPKRWQQQLTESTTPGRASGFEQVVMVVLAPVFLLSIGLLHFFPLLTPTLWLIALLLMAASGGLQLLLVGILGQRWLKLALAQALALAALVTMRGMLEMIVAKHLLDLTIISESLYQGIILMALWQTILGPMLAQHYLKGNASRQVSTGGQVRV